MSNSNAFKIPADLQPEIGELPGDLARLAAIIEKRAPGLGVDITLAIVAENRGSYIYCHNVDALYRKARDRYIREEFDKGTTVSQLTRKVGLGERRIWDILKEDDPGAKRQQSLFDSVG